MRFKEFILEQEELFKIDNQIKTLYFKLRPLPKNKSDKCEIAYKLNSFVQQSPEHLATVLILPMASMAKDWGILRKYFMNLVIYLRDRNRLPKKDQQIGITALLQRGAKGIDFVWKTRQKIYNDLINIIKTNKPEDSFALYLYLISNVPNLGIAKAAFCVQLITGRYGCIDSVNAKFLKMPAQLLTGTGVLKSSVKSLIDKTTGNLNNTGIVLLRQYINFINSIESESTKDSSKMLWDTWCQAVGVRSLVAGHKSPITFDMGTYGGDIKPYRATKDIIKLKTDIIQFIKSKGGTIKFGKNGIPIDLDDRALRLAGQFISDEHFKLPLSAMQPEISDIKKLNREFINSFRKGDQKTLKLESINSKIINLKQLLKKKILKLLQMS